MAQYTITNSCGHQRTYQLYGPGKERDRKSAWLKTIPCPECKRVAEAKPAVTAYLAEREPEIAAAAEKLYQNLLTIPADDREQAIRQVKHQIAEGLGDEVKREALRRATERYEATQ